MKHQNEPLCELVELGCGKNIKYLQTDLIRLQRYHKVSSHCFPASVHAACQEEDKAYKQDQNGRIEKGFCII